MIIDHPVTISSCYSPSWKAGPSIQATCFQQHLVSTPSCVIMWTTAMIPQQMLAHLCTLHALMSELVGWSVQLSHSNHESEYPHATISHFSKHLVTSSTRSRIYLHISKPCSGPWISPHLICNMLSRMFGVNVPHEISHIYPNIIHMCTSSIWRDHLINLQLSVSHIQVHEATSIISAMCHPSSLP